MVRSQLIPADEATLFTEADYDCNIQEPGQGSDRVWYGNSTWATSIDDSNGRSVNRTYDNGNNICSNYYMGVNAGGGLLRAWDSRNTS